MYVHSLNAPVVRILVAVSCLVAIAGCPPQGPETVKVTGTVTLDGEPVEGAVVGFLPAQGTPGTATTDAAGKFTLNAMIGQNGVTVSKSEMVGGGAAEEGENTAMEVETKSLLPIKYSTTKGSGLSFDVQPGMAPVTIELKSE